MVKHGKNQDIVNHVNIYEKDCIKCESFRGNSLSFPGGKCGISGEFCGVGYTCDSFLPKDLMGKNKK